MKSLALSGLLWQMLEKFGVNGVQFLIYIILARLLAPEDFGIVALVSAIIAITSILVNSGLGSALIQSKQVSELDYSTVFYFSLFVSFTLYVILFSAAPIIASFYGHSEIINILRLYSISLIILGINGVQKSILIRAMNFKHLFWISSIPVVLSGAISVALAVMGYGVYALVLNGLLSAFLSVIGFWFILRWYPQKSFSVLRLIELLTFSYKLLFASMIDIVYKNLYPLVIGKLFSSSILGYYNYGRQIPTFISASINASISSVLFPVFSRSQSDIPTLKARLRQSMILGNFFIFPIMAAIAGSSQNLVMVVLTEKWLPSVIYIQLFCVVYGLHHLHNINFQAITALGRSDLFMKYEIIKKTIGLSLLLITVPFGILWLVIGQILVAIISVLISIKPNSKILKYSLIEQVEDSAPYIILSLLIFIVLDLMERFGFDDLGTLFLQIFVGILLYFGLAVTFKLKGLHNAIELIYSRFDTLSK